MPKAEPLKLCECGCGLPASISKITNKARDYHKGQPVRFIHGHNSQGIKRLAGEAHHRWKGGKLKIKCVQCGKQFERSLSQIKKYKNHFCSKSCRADWDRRDIKIKCAQCGKDFLRHPSQKRIGNNFCNRECLALFRSNILIGKNAANWKGGKLKVTCDYCKKEFYKPAQRIKKTKNNFCSCQCHGLWKSANSINEKSANWRGGELKIKCPQCGKDFYKKPSRIKDAKNNFCSNECHGLWKSINQNDENNPNWLGGSSRRGYCSVWTDKEYQEYILSRDNYKCQNPQCLGNGNQLHRHHIDYDKKNCDHNNIITICNSCNSRANSDREWHMSYYQAIMAKKLELGNMHYG